MPFRFIVVGLFVPNWIAWAEADPLVNTMLSSSVSGSVFTSQSSAAVSAVPA